MDQRQAVVRELARTHGRARKKERGIILDDLVRLTGYSRNHAAWVLRETVFGPARRNRG